MGVGCLFAEDINYSVMQMANPSATYCIEKGYRYDMRKAKDGSEYGVCVFKNGQECEAWSYFRGECKKSRKRSKKR